MAQDEILPELKGGEMLISPNTFTYRVHKVRKQKRDTGLEEPLYRLERVVLGNREWQLEELQAAGLKLYNE